MAYPVYIPSEKRAKTMDGVTVGGTDHQILLALRGVGGMTSDQVYARFPSPSHALGRLAKSGLITMPPIGQKGQPIHLTNKGRDMVRADGPLSRRNSLIDYL